MKANRVRWSALALCAALLWPGPARTASIEYEGRESDEWSEVSKEQGQAPLDESFDLEARFERIREQRRKALSETRFDIGLRSFYLHRETYDDSRLESWAYGGFLGLKTGYFRERMALGATMYTTHRLDGPKDRDGALLLGPEQDPFWVLGELYGDFWITDEINLFAGRKLMDTPYINRNDIRMLPNTFQTVYFQGRSKLEGERSLNWGVGYIDKIKERNSDRFVSMAEDAGAASEDSGVFSAGALFKDGGFSLGAIEYFCDDVINIFYAESTYVVPVPKDAGYGVKLYFQYSDQQSVGDDDITGDDFTARQFGAKADLTLGKAVLTAAATSAHGSANMRGPWGGYPGYTSVQVEDFNRDGETALLLKAATPIPLVDGLSTYALWVHGSEPDPAGTFARDELDVNLQWDAPQGPLKGLQLRARYAWINEHRSDTTPLHDLRFIVNYNFSLNVGD